MGDMTAECVLQVRSNLGEGPIWHAGERRLYWLDLQQPAIHRFDPATGGNETLAADIGNYIGGLVFRAKGGWIVVRDDGISAIDPATGRRTVLLDPESHLPGNWFNDAKVDRRGRLWTGSADRGEKDRTGNLWVVDAALRPTQVDSGIICANGPAFSADGRTAWFCDSYAREVYRYDVDPASGAVGKRQLFATLSEDDGYPDGMTVDAEGFLWNAHWDGWRVTRYAPNGSIDRVVRLPVPRVTAMGFGGEDLATLYITTASNGLTEAQLKEAPLSGSLFACTPGMRGLAEPAFAG